MKHSININFLKKFIVIFLNFKFVFLLIGVLTIPVFILYGMISHLWAVSAFMAVFAILFAFIASAIAGYMAGLLGSSNNPISAFT